MERQRVGIDLGTTFSSLSYLDESDKPQAVANCEGDFATPSVVYFEDDGEPIVGRDAVEPGFCRPERFIAHAKRYMGAARHWEIDDVIYTPVDVSAIVLRKLIADASPQLGTITDAVVTVPAHFTGHQRQLTMQAARQAGLENVSVVNEPVAAALAFVLSQVALSQDREYLDLIDDGQTTVLVYDLGGGTFDLSVVQYDKQQLRVLAASGEQQLGGIDWDQELVNIVAEPLKVIHGDLRDDPQSLARLAQQVERAKRTLSNREATKLMIQQDGWEEEFRIERCEFEERCAPLVAKTKMLTEELLKSCQLDWTDLDAMIPVGGSIRMPMISRTIAGFESVRAEARRRKGINLKDNFIRLVSPDLSIAQGAALFAGMIHGSSGGTSETGSISQRLASYKTMNVTPSSLGIVIKQQGQRVIHKLIPRNTPLPVTARVPLATTMANQQRVSVRIVEGDNELSDDTEVICKCTIDNLPVGLPPNSVFNVDITYDADGLLNVVAVHSDTGRVASVSAMYTNE